MDGHKHIPLASLAESGDRVITAVSPSKTFNLAGLKLSALIVPDSAHRAAISKIFEQWHFNSMNGENPFTLAAFEAAYTHGEDWLDALLRHNADTRDFVIDYLARLIPQISVIQPEGTYLLWLDCRKMNMSDAELKNFFAQKAKVGLNAGASFGAGGSGFMRMNIAAPRVMIEQALERISQAMR